MRPAAVPAQRDRRFLLFVGMVMVAVALGFKSELLAQGQVWVLSAGLLLVMAVPSLLAYLRAHGALPAIEHFVPAALGVVAVAGLSVLVPEWWKYALFAAIFGLAFYLAGQLDYRRLRQQEKPGHMIVQEAVMASLLAAAFLVVLTAPFSLIVKLGCIFAVATLAAYRSFRVVGKPIPQHRAMLFSAVVGQVVAFFAWAISVYEYVGEGPFAVMLLLAWYINRDLIRHTVEETFNRQVVLEYMALGSLLAWLFINNYQPH